MKTWPDGIYASMTTRKSFLLMILRMAHKYITRDERKELRVAAALDRGETLFSAMHSDYQWRKTRNAYYRDHRECAACMYEKDIEVHHIVPWHRDPELRYEYSNLISLCQPCHFRYGHLCNFKDWNPRIRALCDKTSAELRIGGEIMREQKREMQERPA